MTRVIAGMTMSLDGFVADRNGDVGRLYADFAALQGSDDMRAAVAETGAVLMGRRTFNMAGDPDAYADTYEFQCPIVVLTHHPPTVAPKHNDRLSIAFVTEGLEHALSRAIEAAGDREVTVVGGAEVIRQLLLAGRVDELHVDVMPVLLGDGARLFDAAELARIEIELIDSHRNGDRVSLRYRVSPQERAEEQGPE